mmetsp:Transcript_6705/g.11909  ORF Transcript_6705/g.11909 Transcript_6705/m.11909 type:complete len:281 (-) Transcript_6705:389-1231(-)
MRSTLALLAGFLSRTTTQMGQAATLTRRLKMPAMAVRLGPDRITIRTITALFITPDHRPLPLRSGHSRHPPRARRLLHQMRHSSSRGRTHRLLCSGRRTRLHLFRGPILRNSHGLPHHLGLGLPLRALGGHSIHHGRRRPRAKHRVHQALVRVHLSHPNLVLPPLLDRGCLLLVLVRISCLRHGTRLHRTMVLRPRGMDRTKRFVISHLAVETRGLLPSRATRYSLPHPANFRGKVEMKIVRTYQGRSPGKRSPLWMASCRRALKHPRRSKMMARRSARR